MSGEAATKVRVTGLKRSFFVPLIGCPGCQHPILARTIGEVLEEMEMDGKAIVVTGIGCAAGIATLNLDTVLGSHGGAPDTATGIKRLRPECMVVTMQGDGDCIAIGAGSFIGAMTRGENITIVMSNNTNYGTTGGQLAPTTLIGQKTATSPDGRNPLKEGYPVHVAELAATFRGVAFSARGALNTAANYQRTKKYIRTAFEKQIEGAGLSFVEVLSACPPNWHMTPVECLDWIAAKMIPEFPLGEFKNGKRS
ncbi:MAG: hypothetical protein FJZ95_05615 [Chloroflexi bacterium]|nr:hypothetical protein [Chloroflexota bacterium]